MLPRYVNDLNRSVVDIVDLKDFKVIHSYKHDVDHMNDQVINKAEFPRLKIDGALIRFQYFRQFFQLDLLALFLCLVQGAAQSLAAFLVGSFFQLKMVSLFV